MRYIAGVFITLAFLILFLKVVSGKDLLGEILLIPLNALTSSFALYSLSHITRSLRWKVILRDMTFKDAVLINSANVFLNNLLPARAGELSWFYYSKKAGFNLGVSLWSFLLVRFYDLISMLGVLAFALLWLMGPLHTLGSLVAVLVVPFILSQAYRLVPDRGRLGDLKVFLKKNLSPELSFGLFLLSALTFLTKFASVYLITHNLWGVDPVRTLIAFTGGEITTVLPVHGVGGYGTYEAGFLIPLKVTGVDLETALKAGFVAHSFLLLSSAVWGLPSILIMHTLYRRSL